MMDDRFTFLREASPPNSALPLPYTFEHRCPTAKGEVELHYWSPRDGTEKAPEHLTLFILGNPGLLNYYIPFLTHLPSLLPPAHAILSTSHIGHSPSLPAPAEPLDLHAQLEAKLELVHALRVSLDTWAGGTRPKLALMGHSVGSWLMCEVMKRVEGVEAGYMLFPTIGWLAETWNGRTLWPIFRQPIRSLIPTLSYLLRPILSFTTFPPTTLSLLRSPTTIRHDIALGASEMEIIREPDLDWIRSQRVDDPTRGLFGLWSGGNLDGWSGKDGPLARECLGGEDGGRVKVLEGVPHAFCLTQENSEMVAEVVASWIMPAKPTPKQDAMPSEQPSTMSKVLPM